MHIDKEINDRLPRVLCITTSFPKCNDDPAGYFVFQLVMALERLGVKTRILTPQHAGSDIKWELGLAVDRFQYAPKRWQTLAQNSGGIPVALKANWRNYLLVPPLLASFSWHILALAKRFDLILANWAVCGALASKLSIFHKKPIVSVLRGWDVKIDGKRNPIDDFFLRAALKGSNALVCVGSDQANFVKSKTKYPRRIYHIPNGIHEAFFKLLPPPSAYAVTYGLFVGSLIERKGVDVLLKAIAKLKTQNIHFYIVGHGPLESELKSMAQKLKIDELVTFEGQVPPGKPMARVMDRSHFLVMPSHHEGRPNVVLEAMASARPVIGSDISGTRELITPSITGFLFRDGDTHALAEAIKRLIESPSNLQKMGKAARHWVLEKGLAWDKTAIKYLKLMRSVMNR